VTRREVRLCAASRRSPLSPARACGTRHGVTPYTGQRILSSRQRLRLSKLFMLNETNYFPAKRSERPRLAPLVTYAVRRLHTSKTITSLATIRRCQ
jgi:hypothetical protein